MKHAVLFTLASAIIGLSVPQAHAQMAGAEVPPPAGELQLPASAQPVAKTVTTTTTTAAPADNTAQTAETATGMPGDPCPNLRGAMEQSPDDLSKVQSDIDRFTLCVQRAQLLERLNESAIKSVEQTDAALGLGSLNGMGGVLPTGPVAMPPLPSGALGGADVTPVATETTEPAQDAEPIIKAPEPAWLIREVFGPAVNMEARLLSPEGDEVKVKKGTRLPDASVVMSITPEGVTLRSAKGVKTLEWAGS